MAHELATALKFKEAAGKKEEFYEEGTLIDDLSSKAKKVAKDAGIIRTRVEVEEEFELDFDEDENEDDEEDTEGE